MLAILLTFVSLSLTLHNVVVACDCNVCELNDVYHEGKGYGCFIASNGVALCTCPDQRYEVNRRCRICDRKDVCGSVPGALCSEISPSLNNTQAGNTCNYACFCADGTYRRCGPCPQPTTTTTTTSTTSPLPTTTTTTPTTSTTTITTTRITTVTTTATTTTTAASA